MIDITNEELARLEGLHAAAEPGDWRDVHRDTIAAPSDFENPRIVMQFWTPPNPNDRALMIAAKNALPSLLATIRTLTKERDEARAGHKASAALWQEKATNDTAAISHLLARAEAAEASMKILRAAVARWQSYGCPDCGGDCASANPPVACCIMQETSIALEASR